MLMTFLFLPVLKRQPCLFFEYLSKSLKVKKTGMIKKAKPEVDPSDF